MGRSISGAFQRKYGMQTTAKPMLNCERNVLSIQVKLSVSIEFGSLF